MALVTHTGFSLEPVSAALWIGLVVSLTAGLGVGLEHRSLGRAAAGSENEWFSQALWGWRGM